MTTATLTGNGDAHSGFRLGDGQAVARCLATGQNAHRYDADTETFVTGTLNSSVGRGTGGAHEPSFLAVTHPLKAEGTEGTDGTGRGVPLVTAYQCHGNNVGPMGTVRSGNGGLTGGVPFTVQTMYAEGKGPHAREADVAKCLDGHGGNPDSQQGGTVVAFDWQSGGDVRLNCSEEATSALQASQVPADGGNRMAVRRLTPLECARLQGFADDWLELTPPLSDSAKYRMLGNAVAKPVARWIGRRLVEVSSG